MLNMNCLLFRSTPVDVLFNLCFQWSVLWTIVFFLLPVFCHYSGCFSIDSLWFPISNFSNISYSDMYCDPMIGLNYVMLIYLLIIFIKDITNIYFLNIFFGNPAGVVCFSNNLVFPLVLFIYHRSIAIYRCVFLVLSIRLIMIIIWYFNWFSKHV